MITERDAIALVEKYLDTDVRPWIAEEVILLTSETVREKTFWVFFYNTRAFIETKSLSHALVGNCPIVISAHDGSMRELGTATPWEEQI